MKVPTFTLSCLLCFPWSASADSVFQEKGGVVAIEAELLEKHGDTVIVLVKGRRYELKIESLSEEDQEFLKSWNPESP